MALHTAFNSQGRKISRASGLERRQDIILATLRLIISEGLRGVRHRAVAQEAGVPLAATTYYFKNLQELIAGAFSYWAEENVRHSVLFREKCFTAFAKYQCDEPLDKQRQAALAEALSTLTANFILEQLTDYFDDRILEQAFYHEAHTNLKLRDVLLVLEADFRDDLTELLEAMGSAQARIDAQITISLIQHQAQLAVIRGPDSHDAHEIRQLMHRHFFQLLA